MEALRLPGQVTRGARGTGRTVTRPQGQCSASSLQALQVLLPRAARAQPPADAPSHSRENGAGGHVLPPRKGWIFVLRGFD